MAHHFLAAAFLFLTVPQICPPRYRLRLRLEGTSGQEENRRRVPLLELLP